MANELYEAINTLRAAGRQFAFYVRQHNEKTPPDTGKAQVNSSWSENCEKTAQALVDRLTKENDPMTRLQETNKNDIPSDTELGTMTITYAGLSLLDREQQVRVMEWLKDRLDYDHQMKGTSNLANVATRRPKAKSFSDNDE